MNDLFNLTAEQVVLASVLEGDASVLGKVFGTLKEEYFYDNMNRAIFRCMSELHEKQEHIGRQTVCLKSQDLGYDITQIEHTVDYLTDKCDTTFAVEMPIRHIVDNANRRKRYVALEHALKRVSDTKHPLDETDSWLMQQFTELKKADKPSGLRKMCDSIPDVLNQIENMVKGRVKETLSGYRELDELLHGLRNGCFICIAGRPSMGKSTLAFNIAHNVSKHQKKRVALFSMEMTAFELILKFMSMETGISTRLLQCHEKITTAINEDAGLMGRLLKGADALSKLEIFIDDASQITISNIRGKLNNLVKEGYKPDLIIFDYLQLIKIYTKTDNRNNQIAELSQELKAIAKDFDVPVIVISQLNRGTETGERKNKRPTLSNLRDSGAIEQDSDVVLLIYRDDYYSPEEPTGQAEIIVAKNRMGKTGTVHMMFYPEKSKFENLF